MRYTFRLFALLTCIASFTDALCAQQTTSKDAPAPKKANVRPADELPKAEPFDGASIEKIAGQCVRLETEAGAIEIELFAESAPESVRSFLNLAATGALDTTTFSRIVKGFVVQGGNLSTRETLTHELVARMKRTLPDEPNLIKHERGVVSMARGEAANTATTHFFILVSAASHLDGKFAAFGRVRAGMEIVDALNNAELDGEKPKSPVRIKRASVFSCPIDTKPQSSQ